jgi:transglutaminase-like putative cysteine protease
MRLRLSDRYSVTVQGATGGIEIVARLAPWSGPEQRVQSAQIIAEPAGQQWRQARDAFGNRYAGVVLPPAPMHLRLTAISELTVDHGIGCTGPIPPSLDPAEPGMLTAPTPGIATYAHEVAARTRDEPKALFRALVGAVGHDLRYDAGATTRTSTAADAFDAGAGVCQDFAHVVVAAARSLGLAAYYVGGYVVEATPDRDFWHAAQRAVPHAWVGLLDGDAPPVLADPTDPAMARQYIAVACGRDFADVQPIRVTGPGARFHAWRSGAQVQPV